MVCTYVSVVDGLKSIAMLRALINSQKWLSRKFDLLLPEKFRIDGNRDFLDSLVPNYLEPNLTIADVGGGKNPYLSPAKKSSLNATVIGLDIDENELSRAPDGAYDRALCVDITEYRGDEDADLVICQAVLEHVDDVEAAITSIESMLRPGGRALIFVPSRNAVFARLNLILPQSIKERLLYGIFPDTQRDQGFPAHYDKCTPSEFRRMAATSQFDIAEERFYFVSSYFSFFFPFYFLWRIWMLLFVAVRGDQAAETFSMVFKKRLTR